MWLGLVYCVSVYENAGTNGQEKWSGKDGADWGRLWGGRERKGYD